MKINFDIDLIRRMVEEEGKMLKEVQTYYNCTKGQLSWFTRKHGLNYNNNPNARKNQSKLMSGKMNPTKGRKRTDGEMEGIKKATIEKHNKEWEEKFKNGITFKQYTKIARSISYVVMKKESEWLEKEIDHIFSLKDCWENKIHPRYASHKENLRLISAKENKEKGSNSLIDLKVFLNNIGAQRLSNVQFNWKQVE